MRKAEPLKVGVAPTRRVIFSIEEAARQKRLIESKLKALGVDIVTIDEVNPEASSSAATTSSRRSTSSAARRWTRCSSPT